MQQKGHLLGFQARSYDQFRGSYTCCLVAERELQKTPQMFHQDNLSHAIISTRFYTYLGEMFLLYIPMYSTIWEMIDKSIFRTAWWLLHHSVWVYEGILIHPLCCIFFMRLYTWPLYRLQIGAPGPLDSRLCWLVLWECGWANPRFRLPVKDGGWMNPRFSFIHQVALVIPAACS
jgi:hypothetical protein